MPLFYTVSDTTGEIDSLLCSLARALGAKKARLAGTVQVNRENATGPCDMDVVVLPDGPRICISQSLGTQARGCRLDPEGLETAVALVSETLKQRPDFLIVNKFGKHESEGRGFRTLIAEALAADIPVLVGVNKLNLAAFKAFASGMEEFIPATEAALIETLSKLILDQPAAAA